MGLIGVLLAMICLWGAPVQGATIADQERAAAPPHPALRAALSQSRLHVAHHKGSRCGRGLGTEVAANLPSTPAGEGSRRKRVGEGDLLAYEIVADSVPQPLGGFEGDAARGKAIILDRRNGNCLICHVFPVEGEPFQGKIGPPMAGVASRLTEGEIRLRLIDQSRINPATIMPPYYRVDGLRNVAPEYKGRPALNAQEIEDVVAYLMSLTE